MNSSMAARENHHDVSYVPHGSHGFILISASQLANELGLGLFTWKIFKIYIKMKNLIDLS